MEWNIDDEDIIQIAVGGDEDYNYYSNNERKGTKEESYEYELDEISSGKENNNNIEISVEMSPEATETQTTFTIMKNKVNGLFNKEKQYKERTLEFPFQTTKVKYKKNAISNQKYSFITFLPVCLIEQFKYFCNLYFLAIALSQFFPPLQVGYLWTYIAPLAFVVALSLAKEAVDDWKRFLRDREANRTLYQKCVFDPSNHSNSFTAIYSSDIKPGDIIQINTNQRVPADVILLQTTEESGGSFIRTDQLDGETDWKLRRALSVTQAMPFSDFSLLSGEITAEKPNKNIYSFIGTFSYSLINNNNNENINNDKDLLNFAKDNNEKIDKKTIGLTLENTMWSNTVVASGTVIGFVVYTGCETRAAMNISSPSSKNTNGECEQKGIVDIEVNRLSKILCGLLVGLSLLMVVGNKFEGEWWLDFFRFIILFSAIIPISMKVNLDVAKLYYCYLMIRDNMVRNTGIPEELGRISYLFTDKTGTLTQNEMLFKKLHLPSFSFHITDTESLNDIISLTSEAYFPPQSEKVNKGRSAEITEIINAIALCHNVTPVKSNHSYQASSPDEIALVTFSERLGVTLIDRTFDTMTINVKDYYEITYRILETFPFTSESKRMSIFLSPIHCKYLAHPPSHSINYPLNQIIDIDDPHVLYLAKGADVVMKKIVEYNDWLEEECGNMGREGLRTLVFAQKKITQNEFLSFQSKLEELKSSLSSTRDQDIRKLIDQTIEFDMKLIGLTGVEDKLQVNVMNCLESLRHAGIKIWMLTGDKIETATNISISSKLISKSHSIFQFVVTNKKEALHHLNHYEELSKGGGYCLVIDGLSLQLCLDHYEKRFFEITQSSSAVVCCRCSPTQKAQVVSMTKKYSDKRTCAIGDGGNDVSMIQAAHVGIGIEGKEGKQASLAADFSIDQFQQIRDLILWHGRNSYQRSARLSQFIIHRGLIISFIQCIFSALFFMATLAVYSGMLLVGYSTYYTFAPVFALVLDEDVRKKQVIEYPELYLELQKGRALNLKTFLIWCLISVYQSTIIMVLSILLFEDNLINIISITFTALILIELINISLVIQHWQLLIVFAEVTTFSIYFLSILLLPTYFNLAFTATFSFWWKVTAVTFFSILPVYIAKVVSRKLNPPQWKKLKE